jgi:hypothetical protein
MMDDPLLRAKLDGLKEHAAQSFFDGFDFPPEVKEELKTGYDALQERRRERVLAGAPLPPGGTFVLGRHAIVAQCLAEFHNAMASSLGIEASAIRLRQEGRRIVADLSLPDDWLTSRMGTKFFGALRDVPKDKDEGVYIDQYLRLLVDNLNEIFRFNVATRLAHFCEVRPSLVPLDASGHRWSDYGG